MKFILVLLVSLGAFQAQAASRDEKALTKLVVETIDLSELDSALKAQPSDLNQLKNTLVRNALRDSEVTRELLNIRSEVTKALSVKNAGSRSYQLKITQYRLLWLAGELGYTPQNR